MVMPPKKRYFLQTICGITTQSRCRHRLIFCRSIIDQAVGATTDNSSRLCVIIGQVTKSQPILPCSGLQAPVALTFGLQHSVTMNGKPRTLIELRHIRAYLGGWDFFSYAAIPITELLQDVKFTEEKQGWSFTGYWWIFHGQSFSQISY